jgi:uncharacterized protein YaiI (UPF0178 family)
MNVIGSRPDGWWKDRDAAMARFVDQLERWAATRTDEVTVVFEQPPSVPPSPGIVEVAHAPRARPGAADDEIVRRVEADSKPQAIRVVTSDRGLASRVRGAGAAVMPAGRFWALLDGAGRPGS